MIRAFSPKGSPGFPFQSFFSFLKKRISTSILNANYRRKIRMFISNDAWKFSSFFFLKKRIKIQGFMPSCKKWKPTQSTDFKRFANSQNRLRICSRFCMGLFFKQSCMRPSLETVFLVHFYVHQWCLDFQIRIFLQTALSNDAWKMKVHQTRWQVWRRFGVWAQRVQSVGLTTLNF